MKKVFIVFFSLLLVLVFIIPTFAIQENVDNIFTIVPSDLGSLQSYGTTGTIGENVITKKYIKVPSNINSGQFEIRAAVRDNNYTLVYILVGYINVTNDSIQISMGGLSSYIGTYTTFTRSIIRQDADLYIPVYMINMFIYLNSGTSGGCTLYHSTEVNQSVLANEYYNLGYNTGYSEGESAGIILGQDLKKELDLVGHLNQFMGMFIGEDHAQYITPIAVVLIILLCYFLFIRWLLALINSKNVTKISDICVCTACIIVLVVMFAPMLNLTIKTESITQEATYETTVEEVESIRTSGIRIEHTETGDIYYGPVGTVVFPVTENVDEVYKIQPDIETEVILYETRG